MEKKAETGKWKWLLCLAAVSVLVWLILRYLLVLFLPLVFAFILTRIVYPGAVRLKKLANKYHLPLSSKICRLAIFFVYLLAAGSFFVWVLVKGFRQLQRLLENLGVYRMWLESFAWKCCCTCDGILGLAEGETFQRLQDFGAGGGSFWKENLLKLPASAISVFGGLGSAGLVLLFSILLTVMALMNLERWYLFYRHCGFYRECHEILRELTGAGYAYVRTQAIIIFCISVLCAIGLFLMGNPYALLVGIGIAIVDALPVFGSGTVFFPWIVVSAIGGNFGRAGILVLLYAGCQLIRQILEPKLMGHRLHIEPAVMLVSVFAGLKLFSVAGVLLGPVGFLLIRSVMRMVRVQL